MRLRTGAESHSSGSGVAKSQRERVVDRQLPSVRPRPLERGVVEPRVDKLEDRRVLLRDPGLHVPDRLAHFFGGSERLGGFRWTLEVDEHVCESAQLARGHRQVAGVRPDGQAAGEERQRLVGTAGLAGVDRQLTEGTRLPRLVAGFLRLV